jgi:hypothetical protein
MKNRKIYLISSTLTAFILVFATLLPWQPRPTQAATNNPAWSTPVTINDDNLPARHQKNPDMVVMDELGIYVVWEDYRNSNSDPDIYFTRSTDEGVTWSANTQVNGDSLSINNDPHIAVDASGTIYVVWLVTVGENGVYFARSVDGGLTWSPSRKIWNWPSLVTTNSPTSPDTDDGTKLDLAADTRAGREGHIHMAWTQDYNEEYTKVGINYATSSNGGDSWNPKKRIAEGIPGWELRAYNLGMAFYHGDIYIAWENAFGNHDIYLARSHDGISWTKGFITRSQEGIFYTPDVTVDANGVSYITYYAWLKNTEEPFEYRGQGVLVRKISWGSTKYASQDRVLGDDTVGLYKSPDLAAYTNGRVFVAWSQKLPGATYPSLYVGESDDYGFSWKTPVMVSQTGHYGEDPALEVDGSGNLYAVWMDRPFSKCCYDIVFSRHDPSTTTPTRPEPFTETIQPTGGKLLSNDPLESVEFNFPKSWLPDPVEVTYQYGKLPASIQSADSMLVNMGVYFDISAKQGSTPVVDFNLPVTVTTHYFGGGLIPEDSINLYWHNGNEWVTDGITTIGRAENVITSTTTHFTHFALFGEVEGLLFLPLITR